MSPRFPTRVVDSMRPSLALAFVAVVCLGVTLIGGCRSQTAGRDHAEQGQGFEVVPLASLEEIVALPFETHDGAPASVGGLAGKPVLMSFIFTRCTTPSMCPLTTRNVARVQALLTEEEREAVTLVSLTFDPEYDTGAVLEAYAQAHGADLGSWQFWRGTPADTERLMGAFNAWAFAKNDDYTHNMRSVILGPDGSLSRVLRDSTWEPEEAAAHLRELAAGPG
jgi:cytochrome oxidase Cu insertion factor (SCO1/SenC/PrrC family)